MLNSSHAFSLIAVGLLLTSLAVPAAAETAGLRLSPRSSVDGLDGPPPASLRFNASTYDNNFLDSTAPAAPLLLSLPQSTSNVRSNALWADWFPFSSGLRTSAGLLWGDNHRSGNVFDTDSSTRSQAFLGFGWTSTASSSSRGSSWRLDADVGLSLASPRDCLTPGGQCTTSGLGLKPSSGSDGMRWNPYISIGASFQY
ncbi:hypothetical protein VVD49_10960 [Uliginosibacterium sp. H3]|uniref:Uncharacterized protein n=1 Tax=Uliginosibacterium silvisoli TaxID=3114758 RepID=A0ABU6K491_9RHOO|nr:hypothetical protein [Uliginosibacterium sp. H3]